MKFNKSRLSILMLAVLPVICSAADVDPLQPRVERLERIIQGQGLMNLITRVDQLQNEVQRLNGENETLRHELQQIQKRQRDMYVDLDERIEKQKLQVQEPALPETGPVGADSSSAAGVVAGTVAGTAVTTNVPSATTSQTPAPTAVENGEAAYQAALQQLRAGHYQAAIDELAEFPQKYPGSIYTANAYYWQGEAKYVLRQFPEAINLFQTVIDQYPDSSKVADALLKKGFSQYEMKDMAAATSTLNMVVDGYPNSSAAKLAKSRLDRINQ